MDPARTLGELLLRRAEERPEQPFLHTPETSKSYGQVADEALRLAGGLRALGLGSGDVLAIWSPNRAEWPLVWFAAALAGMVLNPINPQCTPEEAAYILGDSNARALAFAGVDEKAVASVQASSPRLEHVIGLDGTGALLLEHLLAADTIAPPNVASDDLATLIYTSGTTGRPKGVMLEHRNYIWDAAAYAEVVPFGAGETAMTVLPLFHVNAQVVTTLVPLVVGGACVTAPRFSARDFWPMVARFEPAYVSVVPTILSILLETADELAAPSRTSLRAVVVGAAPLPVDLFRRFEARFGLHLVEGYGLSEGTCVASANPYYGARRIGSIGLPLRGQEMRLVDEDGHPAAPGAAGEIALRGPNVMRGYWNNEEATSQALRDGWLLTGDVGRVDEDGYFFVVDRKKEMIISGGENIYPREIEDVLHEHADVVTAAVIGVPDELRGEAVLAVVVARDPALTAGQLDRWLESRLAGYKRPRFIRFVRDVEIPRTPTGKVRKAALRDRLLLTDRS